MKLSRIFWVYLAVLIAIAGVAIHVGAVIAGPSWFVFFNAPPSVVASARAGTSLAPISALIIAGLMAVCAVYAASAVGLIRPPPFQRPGLAGMAAICLLRALVLPPLAINHPELRNTFEVVSALVWGLAGVGFAVGYRLAKTGPNKSFKPNRFAGRLDSGVLEPGMKTIAVMLALALPSVASCQGWSVETCSSALEHAYSSFSAREHASTVGDFNSDGEADYALLLDNVRSRKSAIGVCLSKEPRPLLVTSPYESGKIFTKPRGTAYKDFETGKEGVYERDAISVGDGARAGASYVLRGGIFARVIDLD